MQNSQKIIKSSCLSQFTRSSFFSIPTCKIRNCILCRGPLSNNTNNTRSEILSFDFSIPFFPPRFEITCFKGHQDVDGRYGSREGLVRKNNLDHVYLISYAIMPSSTPTFS